MYIDISICIYRYVYLDMDTYALSVIHRPKFPTRKERRKEERRRKEGKKRKGFISPWQCVLENEGRKEGRKEGRMGEGRKRKYVKDSIYIYIYIYIYS